MDIPSYLLNFFTGIVSILLEMSPYLLLGFFFAGLLYAFMPRHKIERYFNGGPVKSSVMGSLFGVPLPLCSCGVIPTGAALYKNGASKEATVSFLISTPQTGIDSILATFSLLGLPFAIIRPIAALITGITGGLVTAGLTSGDTVASEAVQEERKEKKFGQKLIAAFRYGFVEFIQDISKWLIIGLLLAAVISAIIPDNYFELLNLPPLLQMLAILVVSVPLYICATGTIPLAAILIMKGISPGAAFVLLMAGPATNAATITMVGKVLGRKSLWVYLSTIIVGALGFGMLIDYALPASWFSNISANHHHHHGQNQWWQITSGIVLLLLIINGYRVKYKTSGFKINLKTTQMNAKTIKVEGMTCNHCKANVENNVKKLPFIENAMVNLSEKTVVLEGDNIDMDKVKQTINELGYKVIS